MLHHVKWWNYQPIRKQLQKISANESSSIFVWVWLLLAMQSHLKKLRRGEVRGQPGWRGWSGWDTIIGRWFIADNSKSISPAPPSLQPTTLSLLILSNTRTGQYRHGCAWEQRVKLKLRELHDLYWMIYDQVLWSAVIELVQLPPPACDAGPPGGQARLDVGHYCINLSSWSEGLQALWNHLGR